MTAPTQSQQVPQTQTLEQPASAGLLDKVLEATCHKVDSIADQYSRAVLGAEGRVQRAMLMADGIERLRAALTPDVMRRVMALQGSRLGFRTDKDNEGGYNEKIVKECIVEAILSGVFWTGNEFNIISGASYVTLNGYKRKVREIPGLTDLEQSAGIPELANGQTVVRYACSWKYNGKPCSLKDTQGRPGRVFAIRVNQKMGTDAILGKAERKALKAVFETVYGSDKSPPDGEAEDAPITSTPPERGRENLGRPRGNGQTPQGLEAPKQEQSSPTTEDQPETLAQGDAYEGDEAAQASSAEQEQWSNEDLSAEILGYIAEGKYDLAKAKLAEHEEHLGKVDHMSLAQALKRALAQDLNNAIAGRPSPAQKARSGR